MPTPRLNETLTLTPEKPTLTPNTCHSRKIIILANVFMSQISRIHTHTHKLMRAHLQCTGSAGSVCLAQSCRWWDVTRATWQQKVRTVATILAWDTCRTDSLRGRYLSPLFIARINKWTLGCCSFHTSASRMRWCGESSRIIYTRRSGVTKLTCVNFLEFLQPVLKEYFITFSALCCLRGEPHYYCNCKGVVCLQKKFFALAGS